jgi:hypothetical protein
MNTRQFAKVGLIFALLTSAAGFVLTMDSPVREVRMVAKQTHRDIYTRPREVGEQHLALQFAASLTEFAAGADRPHRGIVYVPSYAYIRAVSGRAQMNLATTLSVHNTSADAPLVLERIDYHNTQGELVQSYLPEPVALKPFGTIEVFVSREDVRGGSGANFVINWSSEKPVPTPVIEAVMFGQSGATGYSFLSKGRSISSVAVN